MTRLNVSLAAAVVFVASAAPAADPITHSFLATGAETAIIDADGEVVWKYDHPTRDGWVLESGNVLLALNKSKAHPAAGTPIRMYMLANCSIFC